MEKHYTLLKAAELLGVTTQTLRNWDKAGKIHTIRTPGNQRRIPESEIARLLNPGAGATVKAPQKPQETTVETQEATHLPTVDIQETIQLPTIVLEDKDYYLLMCKDATIYDIKKDIVLDESLLPGCMLKEGMDFMQWMKTRYSKETNFSSQRLMQRAFGKFDHEHAAFTTGALSLSDCYWIKHRDEDIQFMDITPYIHKEWDGIEESGIQNEYLWGSLSNLFLGGKSDKRWIDANSLLKVNSFDEFEPYILCSALGLDSIIKTRETDEGLLLSNFTSTDVFYESMEQFGVADEDTDPRDILIENFKERAVALFVLDYLIENNDRQHDDYGFLRNSNTGEYISMAPYHNFDWVWSGDIIPLPETAWQEYREYIHSLCRRAINVASNFKYGTIIEKRASELLHV